MRKLGMCILPVVLLGAGCTQQSETMVARCYLTDDAQTIRISYDQSALEERFNDVSLGVPATLTMIDAEDGDPFETPGYWRDDSKFVYPTGDFFEVVGNTLVGHNQTPASGDAGGFEGIVATEIDCK